MAAVMEASVPRTDRLAVILGGGSELGAFQVGVIDALARHNVTPDLLVGTSVGALNAAYWAFHPGDDVGEQLLQVWLENDPTLLLSEPLWRWLPRLVAHRDHLLDHARLARLIAGRFGPQAAIEDAIIPLVITATARDTGRRVALRRGNLEMALLASTAIPGLFPPVLMDGQFLVDGGVVANCDLEAAAEVGMHEAIVVDPNGENPDGSEGDLIATVEHALTLSLRRQTDLEITALRDRMDIVLLRPTLHWAPRLFDGSHTHELFEMGRAAAQNFVSRGARVPGCSSQPTVMSPDFAPLAAEPPR